MGNPLTTPHTARRSFLASSQTLTSVFFAVIAVCMVLIPLDLASQCNLTPGSIKGDVFNDVNYNGVYDGSESGYTLAEILTYRSDGILHSTVTPNTDGRYRIDGLADGQSYRIQVVLKSHLQSTVIGPDHQTNVRFVESPACNVNFGAANPIDFCDSDNPNVAVTCFVRGGPGVNESMETVVLTPYKFREGSAINKIAMKGQTGSVFGTAWQSSAQTLYTSAFVKQDAFLKDGPGAIYRSFMNNGSYQTEFWFDLSQLGVDFGQMAVANAENCNYGDQVGKVGIGGIEISDDEKYLYVVNLYAKSLVIVDLLNPQPGSTMEISLPDPGCNGGEFRPFAVKSYDGLLYLSATCDASSSKNRADHGISVYTMDLETKMFVKVFSTSFTKDHWLDAPADHKKVSHWLTDIEFTKEGNMLLGIADRQSHRFCHSRLGLSNQYPDLLMAWNDNGVWKLENNGKAGNLTGSGVGNGQGPGGGEFFGNEHWILGPLYHPEIATGSIYVLPGSKEVVSTVFDPIYATFSGGLHRYSTTNGAKNGVIELYRNNDAQVFGKGSGLGNVIDMCAPAPIQIGNFVWIDEDEDGIQDAGELPVGDLELSLVNDNCEVIAKAFTGPNGEYYFTSPVGYHSNYYVLVSDDRYDESNETVSLNGSDYYLTLTNSGVGVIDNGADNDAEIISGSSCDVVNGRFAVIVQTSGPGYVNHTFDIGLSPKPRVIPTPDTFDLALMKEVNTSKPVKRGEIVDFEITIFNQGSISATDIEVTDYMPSGFAFAGILNPGWALQNGMPTYTFTNELKPGASTTLTLSLQVQSTPEVDGYINYSEISSAKDLAGNDRMDVDSTPDRINGNDKGGEPDGVTDNEYQDNGTLDEDDHDPALVKIFDLALIKTTDYDQTIRIGDEVMFTISLINQGQISASTVDVVDYLPVGLSLSANDNNGWTQNGLKLRNQYTGELKPGETVTIDVLLSVNDQAKAGAMINYAEIVSATDMTGKDLTPYDFDSKGDDVVDNDNGGEPDTATDNEYEDDGTIDEDDHDPAMLKIFDLALMKTVAQSNVESVDEDIDYTFTIYNQGDVAAKNIEVVDYLPDGFEFNGAGNLQWQQLSANLLRAYITSSVAPGQSVDLKLTLRLKPEGLGKQLVNVGEISAAQNRDGSISRDFDSTPDRDDDNDNGGDINTATDNLITDDGSLDEDDHDPAVIRSVAASVTDVSLAKIASVSHAESGDPVQFELTVTNEEETVLGRVRIVDYLPFFLENVDPEWRRSANGLYVYRDLTIGNGLPVGGLQIGESAMVTLDTRVIDGTPPGMILNVAEISFMADKDQVSITDDLDSTPDDDPNNDRSDNPNEVLGGAGAGSRPIEDDRAAAQIVISTIELQDSCTCLNNESNGIDGQFTETIVVTSGSGESWFVQEANNFYRSTNPNPAAPIDITGDALVENVLGGGLSIYSISGIFTQGSAWYAVVRNNFDALHSIESGQECRYSRPYIVGVNSVCVGGQEEYEVLNPTAGATYDWTLSDGGVFLTGTSGPKVKIQWDAVVGGPYTLMVNEMSPDNCTAPYSIEVEVGDQFVYSVSCIQETQVSLGPDCETEVTSAMLLTGGPYDYSAFTVILADEHGHPIPNATLTNEHIGKRIMATVLNSCTGNSCWAWLNVEDKIGPKIMCFNDTVSCTSIGEYPYPVAFDACDANPTITLLDELVQPINCDTQFIKRVIRKYIAEDQWGNKSDTCTQEIMLTRIVVDDIQYPDTFSIATGNPLICKSYPADSLGRPLPEYTGIPMFGDVRLWPEDFYCNIAVDYTDIELGQIGCVRKIIREWRVLEWWCDRGFEMITYPQYIEITDTVAPKVICPDVHYVVTNTRTCDADVQIDLPEITDLCSDSFRVDLVYPGGFIEGFKGGVITLPVDTNLIRFRVYDECYNVDSCDFIIIIEDNTPPVAICDQFTTVGLTDTGLAYIYAQTFDDGSYDNCTLKKMEVKRMDDGENCGVVADTFGEYVDFCCEDVGKNVTVMFQVTDKAGNTNTCMVEVEVQDKIPPVFYFCPPTDTINCHYHFDTSDLSAFGEPIVLDNCDFDLRKRVIVNLDQCREGYIERIWVAEDHNNIATCVQRIYIINDAPFDSTNITWPSDLDTNECREGFLTPDLLPERYAYPLVDEDACDLVGISFTDHTFPFVDNTAACYKILRKWKIINWCRFDSSVYDSWTHEQVIKVTNEVPPVITSDCSKIEKCIYDSCDFGYIELFATATDVCTDDSELRWEYHIDLNNDGLVEYSGAGIGNRIDVAREFDLGEHNVRWVFEDGCGNKTVCTQFFDLMNCKGPNAYCKNGIVVDLIAMDLNGDGECDTEMIQIWAEDLDDNSSHPCKYPLTYSIGRDTSIKSVTYDCDDLGRREIEICVTDNKGFQSCCNTFVIVQDNNNEDCCPKTFDKDCVIGPADVNLTDCMSSTDPDDLMSFPITTNCDVDSIVTSFVDEDGTNGDNCLKIKRTWTVELYLGGIDTVCTYTHCITIDNEFTEDSIVWPQDSLIFTDCDVSLDTADTGGIPVLRGEYCDYVTVSYADVEQEEPDSACQSYIRTWTVTNGCDNDKTYTFDQFIRFLNQAPPTLVAPGDITVDATPGLCVAFVSLPPVTAGSCNTGVVIVNDHGNGGADASGVYSVGETTVTFTAEDECGNIAQAVTIVTVVDNQPPSLTCPADMTFDCSVDVDDIDFGTVLATDNCVDVTVDIDTLFSLNDCNIGTITRMVSATDNAGNVVRCQQVITIENQNPFAEVDITWPMDTVQVNVCDSTLPEVTGMPMIDTSGIGCFDITITFEDSTFMTDCDGVPCTIIERTWTVTDSCQLDGMGAGQFIFNQVIIVDGESLTLSCPVDTMISCDIGLGDLSLYGTFSAMSECGIVSETLDTVYNLNTCDVGTVVRTYTVIDSAGMMMTCSQTITVENDNPFTMDRITWPMDSVRVGGCDSTDMAGEPVIDTSGLTCFDITISMSDSMYVDTCEGAPCDITRRKWTVTDSCLLDGMGAGIFCDTQIIIVQGDMLSVSCPPDTLLSCEDTLGDLEDYGSLTFTSPCGIDTVILDTVYNLNACSLGTVVRSILVRDTTGNELSCSQTITIGTDNPFDEGDIIWPEDTLMLDNCGSSHPDSLMSRPVIDSTALMCARLSITFADSSVSSCEQTPCEVVYREWKVVDSCQLDIAGGGVFTFEQVIEVTDTIAPSFQKAICDTTFYAILTSCDFRVDSFTVTVDDCSPNVIVTNNSPHADSSGADASGVYPLGVTEFFFFAEDGCCNKDSILARVSVIDTIPPRIVCTKVFRTMFDSIEGVKFFSEDPVINAGDNCTALNDLRFSFSRDNLMDTCRFYNCDSLRATGGPNNLYIETVYVIDEAGNIDSCEALLQIIDQSGCTKTSSNLVITGIVLTEDFTQVEAAQIDLEGSGRQTVMTNENGVYGFAPMAAGGSYEIIPVKDDDHMNGVTTKDMVFIQRHLLGKQELATAYQRIAADVNNSGNISAADLVDLRRMLLGYYSEFPSNTSWRFVQDEYVFPDPLDPWMEKWPEQYEVDPLMTSMYANFMGMKIGDVSGDVGFNDEGNKVRTREAMEIAVSRSNGYYEFKKISQEAIHGFQFTLNWLPGRGDFELLINGLTGMSDDDFGFHSLDQGILTVASDKLIQPGPVVLFRIPESAIDGDLRLDGSITRDVAYSAQFELRDVLLLNESENTGYVLHQNKPNPFTESTIIGFELPESQSARLSIWTTNGQVVHTVESTFLRGYNEVEVDKDLLKGSGIYYYRLDCNGYSQILKMINID